MKIVVGVDLGSTTSKALILNENNEIIGKGITNSRSNYDVAVDVARTEALTEARFNLIESGLNAVKGLAPHYKKVTGALGTEYRVAQYLAQLRRLQQVLHDSVAQLKIEDEKPKADKLIDIIAEEMVERARGHFRFGRKRSSFFRDLATSDYMALAQDKARASGLAFDRMANLFDKSIIIVENEGQDASFDASIRSAFDIVLERFAADLKDLTEAMHKAVKSALSEPLEIVASVGTGYGRARLPFPREQIRSEILCHGLGAHRMFPNTRTVLDIGGQDTKAIQVDGEGIVTSFQMNDRCAAGCGRYLGYIADEMNLGLHELGPMADQSTKTVKINSTCTVFAGAELRDRLTMGEKREDILAGLHRAIILRAMSLLARSGGVKNEFTFTGGVANNSAAVKALRALVVENYGDVTLNISPDSIFTGALGAATFAHRGVFGQEMAA